MSGARARPASRLQAGLMLVFVLVAWLAGLAWFVEVAARPGENLTQADGIVALTGGAERVEEALRLLAANHGSVLLISGTGGATELHMLTRRAGLDPAPIASRVTLGRAAMSTYGNALETARWTRDNNIRSLIVVTAFYHMPRALLELRRSLPGVTLIPHPVGAFGNGEAGRLTIARLLVEEYSRYLVATTGLSSWLSSRGGRAG